MSPLDIRSCAEPGIRQINWAWSTADDSIEHIASIPRGHPLGLVYWCNPMGFGSRSRASSVSHLGPLRAWVLATGTIKTARLVGFKLTQARVLDFTYVHYLCISSLQDHIASPSPGWVFVLVFLNLFLKLLLIVCVCVCVACNCDGIPGNPHLFHVVSPFTCLRFILQLQRCAFFGVVLSFCSLLIHNDLFSLAALFLALLWLG